MNAPWIRTTDPRTVSPRPPSIFSFITLNLSPSIYPPVCSRSYSLLLSLETPTSPQCLQSTKSPASCILAQAANTDPHLALLCSLLMPHILKQYAALLPSPPYFLLALPSLSRQLHCGIYRAYVDHEDAQNTSPSSLHNAKLSLTDEPQLTLLHIH